MKTSRSSTPRHAKVFALSIVTLSVFASPSELRAQGSLTPPGAPAPVFKTLQQVEPRTDVQTLPGDATSLHTISSPGSYYLTANVIGAPGKRGISIRASNVTLDLNGFAVVGGTGTLDGIAISGTHNNVEIRSGNIEGWLGDGINVSAFATDCRFVNLRSAMNGGNGFNLGPRSIITECQAATNRMNGIRIASGIVKNCTTTANGTATNPPAVGGHGIFVIGGLNANGDVVKDCVADYNLQDGINVAVSVLGKGTIISDCVVKCNLNDGIEVANHTIIRGNKVMNNNVIGIHVAGMGMGNRIEENHVALHPTGYQLDPMTAANLVIKNSSQGNAVGYLAPAGNHVAVIVAAPGLGFAAPSPWTNFEY